MIHKLLSNGVIAVLFDEQATALDDGTLGRDAVVYFTTDIMKQKKLLTWAPWEQREQMTLEKINSEVIFLLEKLGLYRTMLLASYGHEEDMYLTANIGPLPKEPNKRIIEFAFLNENGDDFDSQSKTLDVGQITEFVKVVIKAGKNYQGEYIRDLVAATTGKTVSASVATGRNSSTINPRRLPLKGYVGYIIPEEITEKNYAEATANVATLQLSESTLTHAQMTYLSKVSKMLADYKLLQDKGANIFCDDPTY